MDFWTAYLLACCLVLLSLLKCVVHPWTLSRVVKPRHRKPSLVIKIYTRTKPASSLVEVHCKFYDHFGLLSRTFDTLIALM